MTLKHIRETIRKIRKLGADKVELSNTKRHIRIAVTVEGRAANFVVSTSPSDRRGEANLIAQVKRHIRGENNS